MAKTIRIRRGTASAWTSANPVLGIGEMGLETDTLKFKFGDGATTWTGLSYAGGGGSGGSGNTGVDIHAASSKVTPADADEFGITDSASSFGLKKTTGAQIKTWLAAATMALTNKDLTSGTNTFPTFNQNTTGSAAKWTTARLLDGVSVDGTANVSIVAPATHAATSKTTPVGADEIPLADSAASFGLKKATLTNLMAAIFASPALTGNPTAPTQTPGDNSTRVATTAYTDGAVSDGLSTVPSLVTTNFPHTAMIIIYNAGWTVNAGLLANPDVSFLYGGGSSGTPPPQPAGGYLWVHA